MKLISQLLRVLQHGGVWPRHGCLRDFLSAVEFTACLVFDINHPCCPGPAFSSGQDVVPSQTPMPFLYIYKVAMAVCACVGACIADFGKTCRPIFMKLSTVHRGHR